MTGNKYGDCQLCGEVIESGLSIEPFGNFCANCVKQIQHN
jgi:RNA polymerase-binding transcription factor DksA